MGNLTPVNGLGPISEPRIEKSDATKKAEAVHQKPVKQDRLDSREFYIQEVMKEKGVSREVAEAEVDSFY